MPLGPSLVAGRAKGVDNLNRIFLAETGVLLPSDIFVVGGGVFIELSFVIVML